jgi:hypothetical protein
MGDRFSLGRAIAFFSLFFHTSSCLMLFDAIEEPELGGWRRR